ncbi:MAG: PEP/pyruvate-binding domain-containing protein, partial [Desulfosarcinaceae bacterium]
MAMAAWFIPKPAVGPHPPAESLIPLTSGQCLQSHEVGGKAARLASLARAGFPVPAGFVVSEEVFRVFCRMNRLDDRLWRLAPREAAQAVLGAVMPESLRERIVAAARHLGADPLAVRSSALAEDRADRSMAGQFDTFLHVSPDDVPDRVRACWASLFHAAPRAYRLRMDSGEDGRMGVIVQRQVDARCSGVVFTIDPVSRSADDFVIEWVRGLGDRLVSGQVTPERRHVRRDHLQAPEDVRPEVADVIARVCRWARKAEQHFRQPIDMEWAADARNIYVLQARPVTALTTGRTAVWTNVNLAENFPQPLTPLAWSLVRRFYGAYMQAILRYFGWRTGDLDRAGEVL